MLEHRVEEVAGLLELGGPASQGLLGAPVLRELTGQLDLGGARRGFVCGPAAARLGAMEDPVDPGRSEEQAPDGGAAGCQRAERQDGSSAPRTAAGSARVDCWRGAGALTTVFVAVRAPIAIDTWWLQLLLTLG